MDRRKESGVFEFKSHNAYNESRYGPGPGYTESSVLLDGSDCIFLLFPEG